MAATKRTKFDIAVIALVLKMRKEKKLSQNMIAAYIGTHRSFIGQIESKKDSDSKYNLNHLNQIAYFVGCSPKDFIPDDAIPEKEDRKPKKKHPKRKKG